MVFLSACAASRDRAERPCMNMGKAIDVRVAVLPVENLSGAAAPLKKIRESLTGELKARGFRVLDGNILEEFMAGHRMRHIGGIDGATARALMEQTGAGAVLISSLELYDGTMPPKISLTTRLVSTADPPTVLWMDSAGMAGDDSPGILDLGVIEDPNVLLKKAIGETLKSESQKESFLEEWLKFQSKIDDLALLAFDIYMGCREKICEIKVNRARAEKEMAFKMMERMTSPKGKPKKEGDSDL